MWPAGGVLEFMRRPAARRAYGADAWPLFLMASAQAGHDALVGGLWDTFFAALAEAMLEKPILRDEAEAFLKPIGSG